MFGVEFVDEVYGRSWVRSWNGFSINKFSLLFVHSKKRWREARECKFSPDGFC